MRKGWECVILPHPCASEDHDAPGCADELHCVGHRVVLGEPGAGVRGREEGDEEAPQGSLTHVLCLEVNTTGHSQHRRTQSTPQDTVNTTG